MAFRCLQASVGGDGQLTTESTCALRSLRAQLLQLTLHCALHCAVLSPPHDTLRLVGHLERLQRLERYGNTSKCAPLLSVLFLSLQEVHSVAQLLFKSLTHGPRKA